MSIQVREKYPRFELVEENGTVTQIGPTADHDFFISQQSPGKKSIHLSFFRETGVIPFLYLVKFLMLSKEKIPIIPKPIRKTNLREDRDSMLAEDIAMTPIPYQFTYGTNNRRGIVAWVREGNHSFLEFRTPNQEPIRFSIELAKGFITTLPRLQEEDPKVLRKACEVLLRSVRTKTFDMFKKSEPELRKLRAPPSSAERRIRGPHRIPVRRPGRRPRPRR